MTKLAHGVVGKRARGVGTWHRVGGLHVTTFHPPLAARKGFSVTGSLHFEAYDGRAGSADRDGREIADDAHGVVARTHGGWRINGRANTSAAANGNNPVTLKTLCNAGGRRKFPTCKPTTLHASFFTSI